MSIEKNNINSLVHEDCGFTTTINSTVQNIKHTGALGIYCYLASKPANWNICKKHLQNHFNCGREHIDTCFKYLKEIGAIEVKMIRNEKGQCIGWTTKLMRRINVQIVEEPQNTGNPYSGDLSRIRVSQNLGKPESGKSAPINKRTRTKEREKEKTKKENPSVPVFSNSVSVRSHLNLIVRNRGIFVSEPIIDEIMFYVGHETNFDVVNKKFNIALKSIREGKWKTPYGFHKQNTDHTTIKIETDEERIERYRVEREINMRKINS